jgi:hypothetical protein
MIWPKGHQAKKSLYYTTRRATGTPLGLNRSPNPTKTDEWIGLGPILEVSGKFFPFVWICLVGG